MKLTRELKGELYILGAALMWSTVPIVGILIIGSLTPIYTIALSTLGAAIFFAIVLTWKKQWKQKPSLQGWKYIIGTALVIGILFYLLIFFGLQFTNAGNAALIGNMEVFFAIAILGPLIKHEKITPTLILGALCMIIGSTLIIFPGTFKPNIGDLLILASAAVPAIGNMFQQQARKEVSSTFILFWRSFIAGAILLILALAIEPSPSLITIKHSGILLAINGILLFGFRMILWLEGIHRIPITKANSIAAMYPAFTLIFAFFILGEIPTAWQIAGFIPILIGLSLLLNRKKSPISH